MIATPFLVAALTVLPSDRMAMADRQFDRGLYRDAKAEYQALMGTAGVAQDELLFRLGETERALGNKAEARRYYSALLTGHPGSRHAERAFLMRALQGSEDEQRAELKDLIKEDVTPAIRTVALYHLGRLNNDHTLFDACVALDPKGRYAEEALFQSARSMSRSEDPAKRRKAVERLYDITYKSKDKDQARSRDALYLAICCTYADKTYNQAAAMAQQFLGQHGESAYAGSVRIMAAWSNYLMGKCAHARTLCGDIANDDLAYLRAACALSLGERDLARTLFDRYLTDYPQGRYRGVVELPLARLEFEAAEKAGDATKLVDAARRSMTLTMNSADRLRYAWALENAKLPEDAMTVYKELIDDFEKGDTAAHAVVKTDAAEAMFRRGMLFARQKKWVACELELRKALKADLNPGHRAEALYWGGFAAYSQADDHKAEGCAMLREALSAGLPLNEAREARLLVARFDLDAGVDAEKREALDEARTAYGLAKAAYPQLVEDGACSRMSAEEVRRVGWFLLDPRLGLETFPKQAAACGSFLAEHNDSLAWRQAGHALAGAGAEAAGDVQAAIAAYRSAQQLPVTTEDLPQAMLNLGILEQRMKEYPAAAVTLGQAVRLLSEDSARRMQAYLWLARNAASVPGRETEARKYATIVTTLFDTSDPVARKTYEEAAAILRALGEGTK